MAGRSGLAAVGCVLLLGAGSARAQDAARVHLGWERLPGAEGCPSAAALSAAVEARLGRSVFVGGGADYTVDGSVRPDPPGFRATLVVRGPDGSESGIRELRSGAADCAAMTEPLALVLSLMVDLPSPRTVIELPPEPVAPPGRWRLRLGASGVLAWGLLPGTTAGGEVSIGLRTPVPLSIEATGTLFALRETRDGDVGAGADLRVAHAGLWVCPSIGGDARVAGDVCAGAMAGAIRREAFGLDYERDGTDPFFAAGLLGRIRIAVGGPVAVSGLVGLTFPLRRYRFFYTAADGSQRDLFEVAPVAVSLGIGLTVTP